jgi:uncharacterized protein (DUF924 family)
VNIASVLDFWFKEIPQEQWWRSNPEIDEVIRSRFGGLHERAKNCELSDWRDTKEGRLAEIIILDQFSRNLYRNSPLAFENDRLALGLAQEFIRHIDHQNLSLDERTFLYMPFMHSESLLMQERSIELHQQEGLERRLHWSDKHRDIIVRFGRFPHRNKVLSRESTEEEIQFLTMPGSSF